ncbi:MAG: hypothetical protein Q7V62_07165 [Actinomycetota bacterium]|nr:hypothetical protein [Actinomycetota bacterium]
MFRHSIDPLSGALGLIAVGVGTVVAAGEADRIFDNPVWWAAVVALPLGIAMIPWNHFTRRTPASVEPIDVPALEERSSLPE